MSVLRSKIFHVEIEGKKREILKGVNLTLKTGEITAIMGPNGTGKSTLSAISWGTLTMKLQGEVLFDGVNILELESDVRVWDFSGYAIPI